MAQIGRPPNSVFLVVAVVLGLVDLVRLNVLNLVVILHVLNKIRVRLIVASR